jgi:hypothetical protein
MAVESIDKVSHGINAVAGLIAYQKRHNMKVDAATSNATRC